MQTESLYFHSWIPELPPSAVVVLIHGLGEHCHRYEHVAKHFNAHGFAVMSMDLPCHGQSEGERGHIDSFDVYQDAVLQLLNRAKLEFPDLPRVLLGHSMGGLIASRLLLDHQSEFRAAVLSGPAIQSPQEPPAWQVAIIKGIACLFPKSRLLALDASGVSRDPAVVDAYMADPLVSKDKLTAQFLLSMTQTMQKVKRRANEIRLPLLIMHGGEDSLTAVAGSEFLSQKVGSEDVHLTIYPGLYHEIFNEPEGPSILEQTTDWLQDRL